MSDDSTVSIPKSSLAVRLLRPKVAIPATLVLLLLLSPWLIRGYYLMGVPDIGEPFDVDARKAVVVPDDENAFTDFHQAAALYIQPSGDVSQIRDEVNEHGWAWAMPELEQFLHDNEDALLAWKRGAEKSRAQYHVGRDIWIGSLLETIQELREFTRTALALGRKLEAEGKPLEAWEWYRTAIRTSRLCGQNGTMIERLVGIAIFAVIVEQIPSWSSDPALSSAQLLEALAQLQSDWELTEKPSTSLELEYVMVMNTIQMIETGRDDTNWSDIFEAVSDNDFVTYIQGEPELFRRLYRFQTQNLLTFCDCPAWQRPPMNGLDFFLYDHPDGLRVGDDHWSIKAFTSAVEKSVLFKNNHDVFHQFLHAIDRDEVKYTCLQVVLAGQAFHRDRERFPATLDELVPNYLTEIPVDPFDGRPIKYRLDPEGAVVYSVFENGIDDGGLEFDFAQIAGTGRVDLSDLGLRLLTPVVRPLVAPRPRDVETGEDWEFVP